MINQLHAADLHNLRDVEGRQLGSAWLQRPPCDCLSLPVVCAVCPPNRQRPPSAAAQAAALLRSKVWHPCAAMYREAHRRRNMGRHAPRCLQQAFRSPRCPANRPRRAPHVVLTTCRASTSELRGCGCERGCQHPASSRKDTEASCSRWPGASGRQAAFRYLRLSAMLDQSCRGTRRTRLA
jgi:hypothetical protein